MIVNKITMENFRGFDYKEVDNLGHYVLIEGDNEVGKSTIGDAICFAILGCLANGNNKADKIIMEGKKKAAVEVVFTMRNGKQYRVRRVRTASKSEVFLNDNPFPVTQERIDQLFYQGREDFKKWFLAIFSADYFFNLEPKEMREIITSVLLPPKQEEVLAKMNEVSRQALNGIHVGDIDYMLKNYKGELKQLETELVKMEGSLSMLEQEATREIPGKMADPSSQLIELKKKFKTQLERKEIVQNLINERQKLLTEYQKTKNMLVQIPEQPDVSKGKCPTCGQPVQAHNARLIIEKWKRECEEINAKNQQVMKVLEQIQRKGIEVTERIKAIQKETNLDEIKTIEEEIQRMEDQVKRVLQHNAKVDAMKNSAQKAQEKMEEMKRDYEIMRKEVIRLKTLIEALEVYRKTEAEILSEQISSRLKDVSIQLYEIVKSTGEIKQTFRLLYKGKDLGNCSNSGKRKVHLEVAGALNDITGAAIPIYFDDAESVTNWEWPKGTSQVFECRVVKGMPLTIKTEEKKMERVKFR